MGWTQTMTSRRTGEHFHRRSISSLVPNKPLSSVVNASENDPVSSYVETWPAAPSGGSRPSQRISLISQHQQNLLKSHQDVVTALACIDAPFRGGIVSGDRAGVVKVWRVDFAE